MNRIYQCTIGKLHMKLTRGVLGHISLLVRLLRIAYLACAILSASSHACSLAPVIMGDLCLKIERVDFN